MDKEISEAIVDKLCSIPPEQWEDIKNVQNIYKYKSVFNGLEVILAQMINGNPFFIIDEISFNDKDKVWMLYDSIEAFHKNKQIVEDNNKVQNIYKLIVLNA